MTTLDEIRARLTKMHNVAVTSCDSNGERVVGYVSDEIKPSDLLHLQGHAAYLLARFEAIEKAWADFDREPETHADGDRTWKVLRTAITGTAKEESDDTR